MSGFERLGISELPAIAALCARSLADAPPFDELERTLFAPEQPAVLRGDPDVGLIATVEGDAASGAAGQGFIRILVVAPEHRGRGVGRELIAAGENDVRTAGLRSVTTGADGPFYLWPGVESSETALLCLLERVRGYGRVEANFNMDVDLDAIPPDPGGWSAATATEGEEISAWAAEHWANWELELRRAADRDTLVIARDDHGISAVCAYDVNRAGWIGPVAVRPDRLRQGVGLAPLLGALHRMRAAGRTRAEVGWVGPVVPYARLGARVGRVFFVHRKELR